MQCKFTVTKEENQRLIKEKLQLHFPNGKIELTERPNYSSDAFTVEVEFDLFPSQNIENKPIEMFDNIEERRIGG